MLCAIYKSKKKDGMYLYVEKRDVFDNVPPELKALFGTPIFVMLFNLKGNKSLIQADNQEVLAHLQNQGFYLQMPKVEENLLELHKRQQKNTAH
ncbi:MAG: YcgL domain-containing protein [[Pasteurella] mairii]|uniref:YcgL domain-containing protein NCTC10699_00713 n=1 Tax=[Pasteurella] mairii TaxID=757 RepID=A0A379B3T3_9PAST|nr:YcgL domain-containing protein [[Pasteurella] mairii]SUB33112.1 membrane protein [[Pasteurella] mairii]